MGTPHSKHTGARTLNLGVRVSASEYRRFEEYANRAGYDKVSTWMRETLSILTKVNTDPTNYHLGFLKPAELDSVRKAAAASEKTPLAWARTVLTWWAQEPCYRSSEHLERLEGSSPTTLNGYPESFKSESSESTTGSVIDAIEMLTLFFQGK